MGGCIGKNPSLSALRSIRSPFSLLLGVISWSLESSVSKAQGGLRALSFGRYLFGMGTPDTWHRTPGIGHLAPDIDLDRFRSGILVQNRGCPVPKPVN
jgi:hypothetical protein